ncbi:nitrogen fixation protein NifU [Mycobacterium rhizamassiliense]|jgi:Fe-S cluster biogenesis protein NfuA|uniref:Nitrogen fixation protein NifU n=1 Tax=Mycobacterium rhizamassiliense TaxID=1841860 RepID=A0A2U3P1K0_9MYCO|nr:NifU family protein [Mycobacterium rhizamassiliense]SPM37614.1 nitrogen fixation protein NifU [Mycobacterium rhizamassiliense]
MIPIHATATANPRQLRWVVATDRLPAPGTVRRAPGRLGALLDAGVLEELLVGATDILITVGPAASWRAVGDDVREALGEALQDPAAWAIDESSMPGGALEAVTAELLAGSVGALAASHGGSIELVSVVENTVTVRMVGACDGCPGASSTLRDSLERELRRRVGERVSVTSENDSATISLGKKLLSLIVR